MRTYKLGEIASFIDYRGKTPQKTTSGIPLITAKIVKNGTIETPTEFINPQDYAKWMTRGYPAIGDVVLTTEAPLGEVAQLKREDVALAQRIITLRGNKNVLDNSYLKYFLQSAKGQSLLRARETGTTVVGIKSAELKEIEISLPSLAEQKRIAGILSSLDDKIENNLAINRNLEEQAKAIFKDWFIDFTPFKDGEFIDSPLGKIPKGWRAGKLEDIAQINPPRMLKKGENARSIEMSNLPVNESMPIAWEYKKYMGGMKFKNGDTIVARITPCLENGKTAYINFLNSGEIAFGSTEYIVITARQDLCNEFFYFLARCQDFREYMIKNMNGSSGRQRVSAQTASNYDIVISPAEIMKRFGLITIPLMIAIKENSIENRKLSELRDSLLSKLFKGELAC